jgi:hypothetical protein
LLKIIVKKEFFKFIDFSIFEMKYISNFYFIYPRLTAVEQDWADQGLVNGECGLA